MGCVLARDICRALDGEISWADIRELCSRCDFRLGGALGLSEER